MDPIGLIQGASLSEINGLIAESSQATDLYKALEAGYGTDSAGLVGGAALRRESLEASVLTVTQREEHFVFWRKVPKGKATATIDEWTTQTDIGGVPGSSTSGELTDINESTGEYARLTAAVKYLKDKRRVTFEAERQSQNGLVGAIAKETDNGTKKLLTDADYLSWYGKVAADPLEFDGFTTIMEGFAVGNRADHIIDLRGGTVNANAREITEAARLIWGQGNWGRATDYFTSPMVQSDIDQKLDPAHRVSLSQDGSKVTLGAPVKGIHTNFGSVTTNIDPFIVEGQAPYVVRGGQYTLLISGDVAAPSGVAGVAAPNASSKFFNAHAGNYYYACEAAGAGGKRSALVKSAQVAVDAGDGVTVTATHGGGHTATAMVFYRGRLDGTNADGDFREMVRVAAGSGTTVYVDLNQNIPGTSFIAVMTINDNAINMMRFFESTRFPLYPSTRTEYIWAQIMGCYLRVGKPQQHALIKNVLPTGQQWRPFNA